MVEVGNFTQKVIPIEQGLKHYGQIHNDRYRINSEGHSNRTRIETTSKYRGGFGAEITQKVIPIEQGLKLLNVRQVLLCWRTQKVIPIEQGLKLRSIVAPSSMGRLTQKVIPIEQGLKPHCI